MQTLEIRVEQMRNCRGIVLVILSEFSKSRQNEVSFPKAQKCRKDLLIKYLIRGNYLKKIGRVGSCTTVLKAFALCKLWPPLPLLIKCLVKPDATASVIRLFQNGSQTKN